MTFSRRSILKSSLFGAGLLGLRSLATGIPTKILAKGPLALADGTVDARTDASKAQFLILATSGSGDPLNANAPGTYGTGPLATIAHTQDPTMVATQLSLGGTNTPVLPKEPDVLSLMDTTAPKEMLPSLLGKALGPCLGTIQNQPITLGANSPSEGLSFGGQALPIIPRLALKAPLANPAGTLAGITSLQKLRDDTLSQ